MLKTWRPNNTLSKADNKFRTQRIYVKHLSGHILPLKLSVQKSLIDDIINALDDFDITMFTYSTKRKNWTAMIIMELSSKSCNTRSIHTMSEHHETKIRTLDFSQCNYLGEIYELIKKELELPEWFGGNLDALWDAVTGLMYTPAEIRICGNAGKSELQPEINRITALLQEAEEQYHEISVVISDTTVS